jgi:bifunctional ADP-heptose synthase (sugar kinase/adenylyltransferase)
MGDYCRDTFLYGHCNRISPEAPVPVFSYEYEKTTDGMAGNVSNNIKAFGINCDLLVSTYSISKVRFIDIKSKQHLLRADYNDKAPELIINYDSLNQYDALIISDYNKGSITPDIYNSIRNKFNNIIFVDSKKKDLSIFDHKNTIIKINDHEHVNALYLPKISELIVTKGSNGAMHKNKLYPTNKTEVIDVSGAGDTFLAGLVIQYLLTKDISDAIKFANICASNVVKKSGTAIIELQEVINDIRI